MEHAVILAGGKGTRLKPYTISLPKPLVPIGERPILEHIIIRLAGQGVKSITLAVNHMADLLRAYFGNGAKWGVNIRYSLESKELSTMGPLRCLDDLPDTFLVMNGDVLTDLDISVLRASHERSGSEFTIAAYEQHDRSEYGVLHTNKQAQLTHFEEKPEMVALVSMGMYCMSRSCIDLIPVDTFFGFDHLMRAMIAARRLPHVHVHRGYWLDIGRPTDYEKACDFSEDYGLR
ncbi:MAG: sugar phosphate nucleotidyltransferase [Pseudomonadota bacterium]